MHAKGDFFLTRHHHAEATFYNVWPGLELNHWHDGIKKKKKNHDEIHYTCLSFHQGVMSISAWKIPPRPPFPNRHFIKMKARPHRHAGSFQESHNDAWERALCSIPTVRPHRKIIPAATRRAVLSIIRRVKVCGETDTFPGPQNEPSMTLTLKLDLKNTSLAPAYSLIKEAHRRLSSPNTRTHARKNHFCVHANYSHIKKIQKKDQSKRHHTVVYIFTVLIQTNDKTQALLCYFWSALNALLSDSTGVLAGFRVRVWSGCHFLSARFSSNMSHDRWSGPL